MHCDTLDGNNESAVGFRNAFTELNELRTLRDNCVPETCDIGMHMVHKYPYHMPIYVTEEVPVE